jgi:hypothetical protein
MERIMNGPWSFGWTQLLTIIGFLITSLIAIGGFRTFGRWKRERLEEKRIDLALEALAFVHKSKFIFDSIRSGMTYPSEWEDMPKNVSEDESKRRARGEFYAIFKRMQRNKDFFDKAWDIQVRCSAMFGTRAEELFLLMHQARREIEVSAEMLLCDPYTPHPTADNLATWHQFRADVWEAHNKLAPQGDRVGKKLTAFRDGIEKLCRPVIDRNYGRVPRRGIMGGIIDGLGL